MYELFSIICRFTGGYLPPVDENTDESNQAEDGEGGDDSQRNHSLPLLFPDGTNSRLVAAVTSICREITPKELAAKKKAAGEQK